MQCAFFREPKTRVGGVLTICKQTGRLYISSRDDKNYETCRRCLTANPE